MRLIESLATTVPLAEIFSDHSLVQAMLQFEVALARAEARLKIIPQAAAEVIAAVTQAESFDAGAIARQTLHAGTPAIPLVQELTRRVREKAPAAAGFVHWGATSQDVCDTALILMLKKAHSHLESDLKRLDHALRNLSKKHANTVMLSRTLLQPAPPTTFGLKAAGWLASISRCRTRLNAAFTDAMLLQFGGASGTLAAFGDKGIQVGRALAQELQLDDPGAPWHAHRDRLATLVCACGVLAGSLGKMARDISLLMQTEVGEVMEPLGENRGGSSTMPHKHNPVGCAVALAAAVRVPALVSTFLSAMVQEHERALGGWQAEWPIISSLIQATGLATAAMAEVAEGLIVNGPQMRANISANQAVFAERVAMTLGKKLGRDVAHKLLERSLDASREQKRKLSDVLSQIPEVTQNFDPADLGDVDLPEHYLGVAEEFRQRLLEEGLGFAKRTADKKQLAANKRERTRIRKKRRE